MPASWKGRAAAELAAIVHRGIAVGGGGSFPIRLGICNEEGKLGDRLIPGADALARQKNADQAYLIVPLEPCGLAVTGLSERGVYYGAKTLAQLLEGAGDADTAVLPWLAVLDWPDLAERGEWGGRDALDIPYLADRKMNLLEVHAHLGFDSEGQPTAKMDEAGQRLAHSKAINWVPIITHLDHLEGTGIFRRYPELMGKGENAHYKGPHSLVVACFSQPKTAEILARWMELIAERPGVTDINVWLSEVEDVACGCERCQGQKQFVLEAQAAVKAWQSLRTRFPKLGLRVLLTQGSYPTNANVLAALPAPVGATYYSGSLTYDSSRSPMIYPLLEEFAGGGRWLGVYPQLTASWRIVCPWSGPQFIRCRMNEFVDKGLSCLCGYATPDNAFYDFNVTAAAEWSWNAKGRSEREFAAAWATRRRFSDPDKVAEWAVTLGAVGWDVYGAGIPYPQWFDPDGGQSETFTPSAERIRQRKAIVPGQKGILRYLPDAAATDADRAVCRKSLQLAEELGDASLVTESRVIGGYLEMVDAIGQIAKAVEGKASLTVDEARDVQRALDRLSAAACEVVVQLEAWRQTVAPASQEPRFWDTIDVTLKAARDVGKALQPLGIEVDLVKLQTPPEAKTR